MTPQELGTARSPGGGIGHVSGPERFRRLHASSTRARSGPFRASWVSTADALTRSSMPCVAYAIPTSSGNAVSRNLVRRRLRHAVEQHCRQLPAGDLLIRVSGPANACTWPIVVAAVTDLGRQLDAKVSDTRR